MNPGIYQIRNLVNDKIYIGSSINVNNRWRGHKSLLKKGIHHSKYLQNSWNKYGEANFVFEMVERCLSNKTSLLKTEQKYIDLLKPVYNGSLTAGSPLGFKHTEETKRKVSLAGKGRKKSEEHKKKISIAHIGYKHSASAKLKMSITQKITSRHNSWKPVLQICSKTSDIINKFDSAKQAMLATGISVGNIRATLTGRTKRAGGFIWRYESYIHRM